MRNIFIISIIGVIIWLMIQYPNAMLKPGELIDGHQNLNNRCKSCHEPFWGISSEKCISCHKLSQIGKDSASNNNALLFHGNLDNMDCSLCHTDHKGIKPSFSSNKFNHSILSETNQIKCNNCHNKPLDNLHKQLSDECSNCHNSNSWKSSTTFNHNMIQSADKNNCLSCHQKPNDIFHASFTNNCTECHQSDNWDKTSFNHSAYFILDKNHTAKCNVCHTSNNFKAYTCYGCHEHAESKISEEHREEGISDFRNCISCHKSGNKHQIVNDKTKDNFNREDNHEGNNEKEHDYEREEDDD